MKGFPSPGDAEALRMSPDVLQDKAGTARLAFPLSSSPESWLYLAWKSPISTVVIHSWCRQFLILLSELVPFPFTETMVSKPACLVYVHCTDMEVHHVVKQWQESLMEADWGHKHSDDTGSGKRTAYCPNVSFSTKTLCSSHHVRHSSRDGAGQWPSTITPTLLPHLRHGILWAPFPAAWGQPCSQVWQRGPWQGHAFCHCVSTDQVTHDWKKDFLFLENISIFFLKKKKSHSGALSVLRTSLFFPFQKTKCYDNRYIWGEPHHFAFSQLLMWTAY